SRFFTLWGQPCRLRWCRRHACLYRFFLWCRFFLQLFFRFFFFRLGFLRLFFFFFFGGFFLLFFLFSLFFAFTGNETDFVANIHLATFFNINFGERSIFGRFPFHRRLIGLDLGQHFAGRNFVALLLLPRDEGALGHRVAQFRHLNFRHG